MYFPFTSFPNLNKLQSSSHRLGSHIYWSLTGHGDYFMNKDFYSLFHSWLRKERPTMYLSWFVSSSHANLANAAWVQGCFPNLQIMMTSTWKIHDRFWSPSLKEPSLTHSPQQVLQGRKIHGFLEYVELKKYVKLQSCKNPTESNSLLSIIKRHWLNPSLHLTLCWAVHKEN